MRMGCPTEGLLLLPEPWNEQAQSRAVASLHLI